METVITLALGMLLMAGFIDWELPAEQSMKPMRLYRDLTFSAANPTSFFMSGAQCAGPFDRPVSPAGPRSLAA